MGRLHAVRRKLARERQRLGISPEEYLDYVEKDLRAKGILQWFEGNAAP